MTSSIESYEEKLHKAIVEVFNKLNNMTDEELYDRVKKSLKDDRTIAIYRAMNLDYQGIEDD